jgi:hypothetical protein
MEEGRGSGGDEIRKINIDGNYQAICGVRASKIRN